MKRLLISLPSGPHGKYDQELAWWLTAVQVQSVIREFGSVIAEGHKELPVRLKIRKLAEEFGIAWSAEQAELQWADSLKIKDIWAPMIPDDWSVAMVPVVGRPLAANRNQQVRQFLMYADKENETIRPTDFDAVLFIDDDNVPGRQDLHVLLEAIDRDDVDIVGGVYCMQSDEAGPQPIVYNLNEDGDSFDFAREVMCRPRGLHKLDQGGLPGGCLMVKRKVFEKMWEMRRVWFKDLLYDASTEHYELHDLLMEHKGDPAEFYTAVKALLDKKSYEDHSIHKAGCWKTGEDIWFCKQAAACGFDLWVDTRVHWKHIKPHDVKAAFKRQEGLAGRFFRLGAEAVDGKKMTQDQHTALFRATMAQKAVAVKEAVA